MNELQDFEKQVLERSRTVPVLVDFWAPWCAPCRALGPVLERLAAQANGRWELVKINTEEQAQLAAAVNISSIPAVKLYVNGEVADEFVGALPEPQIRRFLESALPSPSAAQISEAEQLLNAAAPAQAAELLEPILSQEPGNFKARVLMARALLHLDPKRVESVLAPIPPDSDFADTAAALRTLARLAQADSQPETGPHSPLRESYLRAAQAVREGDLPAALPSLIEVIEGNKNYLEAKEACKAIFHLLGMRHPVTERFIRPFSSALHS